MIVEAKIKQIHRLLTLKYIYISLIKISASCSNWNFNNIHQDLLINNKIICRIKKKMIRLKS